MPRSPQSIRRRALRAARAVTMTFALAATSCVADSGELGEAGRDATSPDALTDGGNVLDTGVADTGVQPPGCLELDNMCPTGANASDDPDCCVSAGGSWFCSAGGNGGCGVPGPFVPPALPKALA